MFVEKSAFLHQIAEPTCLNPSSHRPHNAIISALYFWKILIDLSCFACLEPSLSCVVFCATVVLQNTIIMQGNCRSQTCECVPSSMIPVFLTRLFDEFSVLFSVSDMTVTEPEINARLDSLCLSMTEHALGSFGKCSNKILNLGWCNVHSEVRIVSRLSQGLEFSVQSWDFTLCS